MATLDSMISDASRLPVEDRLTLVEAIWDSIPERELPPLSDEWREEIARRSAEYEAGEATVLDWETVRAELVERIKPSRSDS